MNQIQVHLPDKKYLATLKNGKEATNKIKRKQMRVGDTGQIEHSSNVAVAASQKIRY